MYFCDGMKNRVGRGSWLGRVCGRKMKGWVITRKIVIIDIIFSMECIPSEMSALLEIGGATTWNNLRLKLEAQGKF